MKAVSIIEDRTALVAALRLRGVDYLSPSDATPDEFVDDEALIASLAAHSDPRLRQALIALFLLQPRLAPLVPDLRDRMEVGPRQALLAGYMAAVYLQRMWSIRLSRYIPGLPDLPDYFSRELALPEPDEGHGEFGLHALADWQNSHSPDRFNHLSEYEGVADLLFQRLKLKRDRREPTQER